MNHNIYDVEKLYIQYMVDLVCYRKIIVEGEGLW
jgi:hypothetical protein